jgi:hypothetical protein
MVRGCSYSGPPALSAAWPLLSPDLRVAILAIVRSADVAEEAFLTETE